MMPTHKQKWKRCIICIRRQSIIFEENKIYICVCVYYTEQNMQNRWSEYFTFSFQFLLHTIRMNSTLSFYKTTTQSYVYHLHFGSDSRIYTYQNCALLIFLLPGRKKEQKRTVNTKWRWYSNVLILNKKKITKKVTRKDIKKTERSMTRKTHAVMWAIARYTQTTNSYVTMFFDWCYILNIFRFAIVCVCVSPCMVHSLDWWERR